MKAVVPVIISTKGYGVLVNTCSLMTFHDDVYGSYIWTDIDDEMDYYFIHGPEFDEIIKEYRFLTGKAPMFPKWMFGYAQSKERYETHHGVRILDSALVSAATLSHRYISDRFLPDKAIDLLDEAGAMKKIDEEEKPLELEELEASISELTEEKRLLVQNQDYEAAAEIRDRVHLLRGQLEAMRERWEKGGDGKYKVVTVDDVASVVASITGIPLEQLTGSELARLLNMEEELLLVFLFYYLYWWQF